MTTDIAVRADRGKAQPLVELARAAVGGVDGQAQTGADALGAGDQLRDERRADAAAARVGQKCDIEQPSRRSRPVGPRPSRGGAVDDDDGILGRGKAPRVRPPLRVELHRNELRRGAAERWASVGQQRAEERRELALVAQLKGRVRGRAPSAPSRSDG
jgi:hypothetical protein